MIVGTSGANSDVTKSTIDFREAKNLLTLGFKPKMKRKMAARHILNGLGMTLLLALGASLVYVTVLLSSETLDDTSREKRSLLGDNEYLFKNSLHRIHWAKTISATAKSSNAKGELPNPQRFDKKSDLEYIFISVKTATKFHLERLQVILDTWFKLAPEQVSYYFYSMILYSLHEKSTKNFKCVRANFSFFCFLLENS